MIGYFSQMAAVRFGSCIYKTPDGREVEVTAVVDYVDIEYGWTDKVLVGEVTDYVRKGQIGVEEWADDEMEQDYDQQMLEDELYQQYREEEYDYELLNQDFEEDICD